MNNNIYSMVKTAGMVMPYQAATGPSGSASHEQGGKYGQENVRRLGGYKGIFNTMVGAASLYPQIRQITNAYRLTNATANTVAPFIARTNNTQSVVVPMHRNQSLSWQPSGGQLRGYRRYDNTNNSQAEFKLEDDLHEQYTKDVYNGARKKLNTKRQLLEIQDGSDIIVYNPNKS